MRKRALPLMLIIIMLYTIVKTLGIEHRTYKCVITNVEHVTPFVDGNRKKIIIDLDEKDVSEAYKMAFFHYYLMRARYVESMKKEKYVGDKPISFKVIDDKGREVIYNMTDEEIESVKESVSSITNIEIREIDFPELNRRDK